MEIGSPAVSFLIDTWEGHLTPQEAASIADRASRGRDAATIKAAAKLALSCLPHAHALNPNEIQRAIIQVSKTGIYQFITFRQKNIINVLMIKSTQVLCENHHYMN